MRPIRFISADRAGVVNNDFEEGETVMRGPTILARSMSIPTRRGKEDAHAWQYHSQSDSHSKVACWTLLFDLLLECDVVRSAAEQGRLGFRINHMMIGPINKTLDLVLTVVPTTQEQVQRRTFAELVDALGVVLDSEDCAALAGLPTFFEDRRDDVSEVAVAVEAKACMTAHVSALPRLHAEILATGYLAKRATPRCITVLHSLVNAAPIFHTVKGKVNKHKQPEDALRVVQMLKLAVPTSSDTREYGYDCVGTTVVDCRNDGSPVLVIDGDPAPSAIDDRTHYSRMVRSLCSEFRSRRF